MEQSQQEVQNYQEDGINLRELVFSLMERKFFIIGLTAFLTILAIQYARTLVPIYQATSSFTSPSTISMTTINKLDLTTRTKDSIFSEFLTLLSSKDLQKLAFIKGDFLNLFNSDNRAIDDTGEFISKVTSSIRVNSPNLTSEEKSLGFLTELPYTVSIEGVNAVAISEYLNALVDMANAKTITGLIELNEINISNRIDEISLERDLLIEQAKKDRFSTIERIKEEDGQKIRQINGQIDRTRYMEKENRLNQIVVLIEAAKLAKSLGIIENNFKLIKGDGASSDLTIAIGENKDLPEWYLYGEKALLQRVELLQNRTSDDPFIPELVTLNSQLNKAQNNNLLITLETRQDDSPFIDEIVKLDIEKIKLKSRTVFMNGVNAMQLSQISMPPEKPIKPNKRRIVLLAFIASFMMSIFLALIIETFKPNEKAPTA